MVDDNKMCCVTPSISYFLSGYESQKNSDGTWKVTEDVIFPQAWEELEKLFQAGKIKAIGVSNFSVKTYVNISSLCCSLIISITFFVV